MAPRLFFAALVSTGATMVLTGGVLRAQSLPSAVTARIDSVFSPYDSRNSPGCAISVVRDGRIAFEKGYGMSDFQHDVPITPGSIFHVASISKQFAAMSVVLLAREGKLSLDDDVRKHVPEVPDFGRRITIRQLIHHTSGLRDQWQLLALSGWRADDPKSESDILWLVGRQKALNFEPGAEHLYSNTGYTLLGTIVKRVSGRSLREFAQERIFGPLGMTSTHFHDDHTMIVPGRTSAYVARQGAGRGGAAGIDRYAISIPVFDNAGATSLFTTVRDMARWDANFLAPAVGDSQTITQMHERGRLNNGTTIPYAFGLVHGQFRGLTTIGHSGSDAGYRADFLRFPDQRSAFVTLCNVANANPGQLNRSVASIVLAEHIRPEGSNGTAAAAPVDEVPLEPDVLRGLAGVYLDTLTETFAEAVFQSSTGTLHAGRAVQAPRLRHVGNNEFVVIGPNGTPAARYRFEPGSVTNVDAGVTLRRVNPADVSPSRLAGFAGAYRSEELDVEWTIAIRDSALMLSRRRTPEQRLSAIYADGFAGSIGNIRFTRDASGKVTGFLLTSGRIRHVRFERR
jgi:CubicO group peptidase (beta-lactamase class C family)